MCKLHWERWGRRLKQYPSIPSPTHTRFSSDSLGWICRLWQNPLLLMVPQLVAESHHWFGKGFQCECRKRFELKSSLMWEMAIWAIPSLRPDHHHISRKQGNSKFVCKVFTLCTLLTILFNRTRAQQSMYTSFAHRLYRLYTHPRATIIKQTIHN